MMIPPYYAHVLRLKQLFEQCDTKDHEEIIQAIICQATNNIKRQVPSTLLDIFYQHNCLCSNDIDTLINQMNHFRLKKEKKPTTDNIDVFSKLNQDIINNIGSFLQLPELPLLGQLNKNLHICVNHDSFKFIRGVSFIKLATKNDDIKFDNSLYNQKLHDCYDYWFNDQNNDSYSILNCSSFDSFIKWQKPPPFHCGVAHKISLNYANNDGTIKEEYTSIIESMWFKGLFKCVYSLKITAWSQIEHIPIDILFTCNQYNLGKAIKCIELPSTNISLKSADKICQFFETQFKKLVLSRKPMRMIQTVIVNGQSYNNLANTRILSCLSGHYKRLFVKHHTLTIDNHQTLSRIFHTKLVSLWLKNECSIRVHTSNDEPLMNMKEKPLREVVIVNKVNNHKEFRELLKILTRYNLLNESSTLTITQLTIEQPIPTCQTFHAALETEFKKCLDYLLLKKSIFQTIIIRMDDNVFLDKFGQLLRFLLFMYHELTDRCEQNKIFNLCCLKIHFIQIVRPRTADRCFTKMQMRFPWDPKYTKIHRSVRNRYQRTVNEIDNDERYDSITNYDSVIDIDWEYDLLFDYRNDATEIKFRTLKTMDKMAQLFKRTMVWFNVIDLMYGNLNDRCIILKMC